MDCNVSLSGLCRYNKSGIEYIRISPPSLPARGIISITDLFLAPLSPPSVYEQTYL